MLVDVVLEAAGVLLQSSDQDLRGDTNAKLKDLKAQWEETSTYIIHCHRCAYVAHRCAYVVNNIPPPYVSFIYFHPKRLTNKYIC